MRIGGAVGFALLSVAAIGGEPPQPMSATLTVTVSNVRSSEGQVRVAVYTSDNWLGDEPTARVWTAATGTPVTATFTLPAGRYAVAVLHDENDNGKMDYRLLRLPKEPYGFSNDARPKLGPPTFEDAAFALAPAGRAIAITLSD